VFNHTAAWNHPWIWAGIHALFIFGISAVCLVGWQLNERVMAEHLEAEEELRAEKRVTDTLYDIGQVLAAELDTQRVVQTVTDAATQLTGAAFGAFFYNVVDESGGKYMLYSLSGAPVEAFSKFGLPRATALFGPTFAGEGVLRIDDVRKDSRYGLAAPHFGMPKGHLPVVSYLAVPVRTRAGEVLGGLFFGHPERGQFNAVHERVVVGIAAQAAIALDNAQLYARQRTVRSGIPVRSARSCMSPLTEREHVGLHRQSSTQP
jgi:GAF domain-containing protein